MTHPRPRLLPRPYKRKEEGMTSSFFGAGSSYDFHKTCMNELARSLTHVNRDKEEKVSSHLLMSHTYYIIYYYYNLGTALVSSLP